MRRVVVHEILLGAGLASLLVAALVTGAAQRDLRRFEHEATELRATLPPEGREGWEEARRMVEEAEFEVRATRELRRRLWRPTGMALIASAGGVILLAAGLDRWRRRGRAGAG